MSTWSDIIRLSLQKIGAHVPGDDPPPQQELQDGLTTLRGMLESWSLAGLMIPGFLRTEFEFGQEHTATHRFSMSGEDPDIPGEYMEEIHSIRYRYAGYEEERELTQVDTKTLVLHKENQIPGYPTRYAYENSYPQAFIELDRRPLITDRMIVIGKGNLITSEIALGDSPNLPPGYERAIRYNLALELVDDYGKKGEDGPTPLLIMQAREAKKELMRRNSQVMTTRLDRAVLINQRRALGWGRGWN